MIDVVGGLSLKTQEAELKLRPDVVVSTPGRLIDHVRNTPCFNMDGVEVLVLDEADRMLEEVCLNFLSLEHGLTSEYTGIPSRVGRNHLCGPSIEANTSLLCDRHRIRFPALATVDEQTRTSEDRRDGRDGLWTRAGVPPCSRRQSWRSDRARIPIRRTFEGISPRRFVHEVVREWEDHHFLPK
jgi:hypothetical protein